MRPFVPKETRHFPTKHLPPWLIIAVAGCSLVQSLCAQQPPAATGGGTAGGAGSGTTGGAASGTDAGAGTKPGGTQGTKPAPAGTEAPPPAPGGTQKPQNPFGFGDAPATETKPGSLLLPGSGASSNFGTGLLQPGTQDIQPTPGGGAQPATTIKPANAPAFTAPGRYGGTQQIFDTSQGRFTRPRYRYGVSFSMGFDDNTQQTPDDGGGFPGQEFVQVIPAQPEISQTVTEQQFVGLRPFNSKFVPVFRTVNRKVVLRPASPEQEIVQVIPGIPATERNASVTSGLTANVDIQWATSRSLFTFDLRAGADYYWNRTTDPLDYNGSMSLVYVRRFGPRIQFSANASASYSSQPDYSNLNAAQTSSGTYFTGTSKFDLEYKWSSRFSTDTSLGLTSTNYLEGTRTGSSYWEATLGNEFRHRFSPRITSVVEARYAALRYYETDTSNSNTAFVLVGADLRLSPRFRGNIRLGESLRSFQASGITKSTPYGEMSVNYQRSRRDQFSASLRYGFEAAAATAESTVLRSSLGYAHAFSPRLNSQCSLNYVRTSSDTGSPGGSATSTTSEVYDSSLVLSYLFSRRLTFSARYSFTLSAGDFATQNYDRSRFFLTGEYNF